MTSGPAGGDGYPSSMLPETGIFPGRIVTVYQKSAIVRDRGIIPYALMSGLFNRKGCAP